MLSRGESFTVHQPSLPYFSTPSPSLPPSKAQLLLQTRWVVPLLPFVTITREVDHRHSNFDRTRSTEVSSIEIKKSKKSEVKQKRLLGANRFVFSPHENNIIRD